MEQGFKNLRATLKRGSLKLLNEKARLLVDSKTLESLPENTNFFSYITGYDEKIINKRMEQVIESLSDNFFTMPWEDQQSAKEKMVEEFFNTRIDLKQDLEFASFLLELLDKLMTLLTVQALGRQNNPVQVVLKDPRELSAQDLKMELNAIKDFSKGGSELDIVTTNFKRYIVHLQSEYNLLKDATSHEDLTKKLKLLDENIIIIKRLEVPYKTPPASLADIKSAYGGKYQTLEELEQEKESLQEQAIKAKETEEVAMIKKLKGAEGDKLEPNGLTKRQAFALKLFNEAYDSKRLLPEVQKKFVQEFLVSALGNMRLNKALGKDDVLSRFTYKTRNPEIFLAAAEKLLKIEKGEKIKDEDRLSLREYGILLDYTSVLCDFNDPSRAQLLEDDGRLKSLYEKVNEIKTILEIIDESITKEAKVEINSGDLLLNDIQKRAEIANKKVATVDQLTTLISKHLHTVKLVQKDEQVFISHAHSRGRGTDAFNVRVYLFSDVYKVDVMPLINKELAEKLTINYGENYAEVINKKYRDIEKELHQDTGEKFAGVALRADSEYIKTFFADFIGYLGHNKLVAEDLDLIHKDIMAGAKEKNRMLCSEFAARTTVAAFIELNNKLKEELGVEKDVIIMPFTNRERFRTMHPDRLVKILSDAGCITEMERTDTEKKYFSFANKIKEEKAAKESSAHEKG
jgi:hypothetical protein